MELCKYPEAGKVRTFHIEAIQIPIVYNKYGDYDPDGLLYVLEEDAERIRREALKRFQMEIPQPYEEVRPLVIRVNLGDRVKVRFRNSLNRRLSMHVQGLSYDVNTSDGSSVGYNNDSTTCGEIWYTWYADTEGVYLFNDMADPRSTEDATNIHGLFGAIIVEPPEARWLNPETGEEMKSGLMADIYQPGKPAFREYSVFFHDELEILNKEGEQPIDPHTGLPSSTTAISYRSEPMREWLRKKEDPAYLFSSFVHGDPATPVWKAYPGDRVIFRTMMPADKPRNTSLAVHDHLWREQRRDPFSRIIPLQGGVSVGNKFDMELLGGAGCPGDYLYRSGSFAWDVESGMWGIFRVVKQTLGCRCKGIYRKIRDCLR